eukprot:scaffold77932_cov71-Phaeocystis_antarctica.AAC.5
MHEWQSGAHQPGGAAINGGEAIVQPEIENSVYHTGHSADIIKEGGNILNFSQLLRFNWGQEGHEVAPPQQTAHRPSACGVESGRVGKTPATGRHCRAHRTSITYLKASRRSSILYMNKSGGGARKGMQGALLDVLPAARLSQGRRPGSLNGSVKPQSTE